MKSNHKLSHSHEVDPESAGYEYFSVQVDDLPAVNITKHQLLRFLSGDNTELSMNGSTITITATATTVGGDTYEHPPKAWVNKSNLSGAWVISNLAIDAKGHPTNWTIRQLTPENIGAAPAHNHPYDNYNRWRLQVGATTMNVTSDDLVKMLSSASNEVAVENGNIVVKRKPKAVHDVPGTAVSRLSDWNNKWMNITGANPTFTVSGTFKKDDEIEGSFTGTGRLTIVGSGITLVYSNEFHQNKIPAGGVFGLKFLTATKAVLFGKLIPIGL